MTEPELDENSILGMIVARKRSEVAARKAAHPREVIEPTLAASDRSLESALAAAGPRFILECKRASPSRGLIRHPFDVDDLARGYRGVADALSVLTDETFFRGSFEILAGMRERVDVPVLCKDFVVDPWQVLEARSHGADAVLLMMSVLDDETARACLVEAAQLKIDCLVEVHNEDELHRAIALDARILGINNRDLKTLKVDLSVTTRLAPLVPSDRLLVCESGIRSRRDIDRLASHVDAFLVGSSLMSEPDLASAARALVFGRMKICGLTSVDDARAARDAGATYGGLIFVEASPRCIDVNAANEIVRSVAMPFVGVFVNERPQVIADIAVRLGLVAVQLHGREDDAHVEAVRAALPDGVEIWRAVPMSGESSETTLGAADRLLFDTSSADAFGGTGTPFDWNVLTNHPHRDRALLAGGLDAASIADARAVGAWALDVGSRIESQPGRKNHAALTALFHAARLPSDSAR